MAPPPSSLYTVSFLIAILATLFVSATLRLLAILPNGRSKKIQWRKRPPATRILIVLGSGGHTHEMFHLLRSLDTSKYTHRTYVVSSGDAFSAQRARDFEAQLEREWKTQQVEVAKSKMHERKDSDVVFGGVKIRVTDEQGRKARVQAEEGDEESEKKSHCFGPEHFDVAVVPRARRIHQSLLTTPFSCLWTFICSFGPLLGSPPLLAGEVPRTPYERAAADLPDLIITNGPATAVIIILASLMLRFVNWRGANGRAKCRTVYVESFARVKTLSLSGKLLLRIVDRFLVQWEELEGAGGRAEFCGVLV